jgi:hypothetical protein
MQIDFCDKKNTKKGLNKKMQPIGHTSTYFIRTKNIEFNKMIWIVLIVIFLIPIIILVGFWISHDGLFCQSVVNINGTAMYNHLNSSCS